MDGELVSQQPLVCKVARFEPRGTFDQNESSHENKTARIRNENPLNVGYLALLPDATFAGFSGPSNLEIPQKRIPKKEP